MKKTSKKKMNKVAKSLKKVKAERTKPVEPVWKGPSDPEGGITQSLLSMFLCCRERFRLRVIEGLGPPDQFNHRMEYGSMWHLCEEVYARSGNPIANNPVVDAPWVKALKSYCQDLCRKYPLSQDQIVHWMNICLTQFPIYLEYWAKTADEKRRKPYMQEQVFGVPYSLPSGRMVRLRGKWDGVSQYGRQFYLDENKTKGEVNVEQIRRQMDFDLQTMLYLVALRNSGEVPEHRVAGVRYNVVLRPLSGGKNSIRQHKPTKGNPSGESDEEFYARLGVLIAVEPGFYFHRWTVDITSRDVDRFCTQFLTPILEQLCDWWEWMQLVTTPGCEFQDINGIHWRTPYGFYNVLGEGGSTDVDEYLATGSEVGLVRGKPLFQELEEE